MSFKNMKRDDHGHVIGNDETDGQKCKHNGSSAAKQDFLKRNNAAPNSPLAEGMSKANEDRLNEAFDDDYEEEFKDFEVESPEDIVARVKKQYEEDPDAFGGVSPLEALKNTLKYNEENPDVFNGLDKEKIATQNKNLKAAINILEKENFDEDDDVLDEQFGKDTPERKLAGAMKQPKNNEIPHKPVDMPKYHNEKDHIVVDEGPNKGSSYDSEQDYRNAERSGENDLDPKQGLDKLGISQGFGKRVPKKEFEQYVKLSDEDKLKLRRQGYLQNYHGYDIEEIGGRDEYRVWKLGK